LSFFFFFLALQLSLLLAASIVVSCLVDFSCLCFLWWWRSLALTVSVVVAIGSEVVSIRQDFVWSFDGFLFSRKPFLWLLLPELPWEIIFSV
jgi:hypothetical protein